ncbi:MAG TPA: cytochrome c oxidase subunit II [Chloroflexota bacterium]|nr:cytochrome c oxidase subunit II [Chloroflexota bacterium]
MPRHPWASYARALTLSAALLLAPGCAATPTVLVPASSEADEILHLTWIITGIAAAVFFLVTGLLLYCAVRFRAGPDAPTPPQIASNHVLEFTWTIIPIVILAGVVVATIRVIRDVVQPNAAAASTLHVRVVGHQWWWEFQYLDQQVTTANEAHVPVGEMVEFQLDSDNVIHSFWVPQLFGKTDVIPGHDNRIYLHADTAGVYRGECAEFCGLQHANMRLLIVAEPPDQFAAWVRSQQGPAATVIGQDAQQGRDLFMASTCAGCHTIQGSPAQGQVGPDLTHLASRAEIAAGTLPNTSSDLADWLSNPQAVKPGSDMPNLNLDDASVAKLVAFLSQLE